MITLQLWITLLMVVLIYFLWTRRKYYLLALKIPGPLGYPILGMAPEMMSRENVLPVLGSYIDKYGSMMLSWLGPTPFLVLSEPQLVQDILTSPHCVNKSELYKAANDSFGFGLISIDEPHWSTHRKLVNPAFGSMMLQSFLPIFNHETAGLLQVLNDLPDNVDQDMDVHLQSLTLGIAIQTTLDSSFKDEQSFKNKSLQQHYSHLLESTIDMGLYPWLNSRMIRKLLGREHHYAQAKSETRAMIKKVVDSKLSEYSQDVAAEALVKDQRKFINLLIEQLQRGVFSMQDVLDESNVILAGAFEASANTLTHILMLLAMFPEYQEQAFQEIKALFPQSGDFEVSFENTQQLVYLEMIINESMRVMAPATLVARQASEDVLLSNGITVPKDMQIGIAIFHMHRRKSIWGPDAETFNPEHCLPANLQDKHPYAFIPFTKGIRHCIGFRYGSLMMKVVLAKLLRNYKFSTSYKFEDLHFVLGVTIKLKYNPPLKLEKRY